MTLGELKKSLSRFGGDMDDCEVLFMYKLGEKIDYDCLAFVAYIDEKTMGDVYIVLGSMNAALDQLKKGNLKNQSGISLTSEGYNV